jgi:hypothetical protein
LYFVFGADRRSRRKFLRAILSDFEPEGKELFRTFSSGVIWTNDFYIVMSGLAPRRTILSVIIKPDQYRQKSLFITRHGRFVALFTRGRVCMSVKRALPFSCSIPSIQPDQLHLDFCTVIAVKVTKRNFFFFCLKQKLHSSFFLLYLYFNTVAKMSPELNST